MRRFFQLKMILTFKAYHDRHMGEPHPFSHSEMAFVLRGNLIYHMRIHTGEKPHQCTDCEKVFAWESILAMYRRIHTGEKLHQYSHCAKALDKKLILQSISRYMQGRKYINAAIVR